MPVSVIAIVAGIIAVVLVFAWRENRSHIGRKPAQRGIAPPAAPPPDPVLPELQRLSAKLAPLAEKTAHPRELAELPEFKAVVTRFSGPDVPLGLLHQYACGANWPLSCAALLALCRHPQRNALFTTILGQLGNLRPWALHFALKYFAALEPRPPVGAPIAVAEQWWAANLVIPDLFREYLETRRELGDRPDFGTMLESAVRSPPDHISALLAKIEHPFAIALRQQLREWQDNRIDREFLASFGRFWSEAEEGAFLIEPDGWTELLAQAQSAATHVPPRSILLSGEAHVGKTSFLRLLGARLAGAGWTIFETSGVQLQADQVYIGQLEGRIRRLVDELDARKRVAWYAPEILQLAQSGTHAGQSASILDQILPAIAAGRLVLLGETTHAGATRLFQLRPALRSHVEVYRLEPMSETAAKILTSRVVAAMQQQLDLRIEEEVVDLALELAPQYLGSDQLPGTVIELIKRAGRRCLEARETAVSSETLVATLSQITGLPRSILDEDQRLELGSVRQFFSGRVMGQSQAVEAVVDRIAMLKAGLVDPDRPVGVFLFAGPTGTGKTELAKTLADFLFGSPDRMARLDMSEFQSAEAAAKIVGQRGYSTQTDSLIDRVRKQPFCVILLDEFEKAHANIWDLFLQIFDDGRLTDANGKVADFRHSFIILTSNLGATSHLGAGLGFVADRSAYGEDQVLRAIGQTFRPEFVNRLDKIIVFRPLSRDLMREILRKELNDVLARRGLRRRDWAVEWESSAIEFLLDRGFSPEMGARPLKRAIDQHLLAPLAATLVEHRFPEGDQFLFVRSNGKAIEVEFVDPDADVASNEPEPPPVEPGGRIPLSAMILKPTGTPQESADLIAAYAAVEARLASREWGELKEKLQAEIAAPDFWSRSDRQPVFARLGLMDRVGEAARTAERLKLRLEASGTRTAQTSRELISRLALQLHLLEQGFVDALQDAPIDALAMAEPVLDGAVDPKAQADWCARLIEMYRLWAERRHMQLDVHAPPAKGAGPLVLQVSGFGAYRTLASEVGLHVLEGADHDSGPRTIARVKVAPGLWQEPAAAHAYRDYLQSLSQTGTASKVVRRYREGAAPLVRDARGGWRSGRLQSVLAGNFDLIGALQDR